MIVEKNRIIELANKLKVLIVEDTIYQGINYYLAVALEENNDLTNKIVMLEKKMINDETYVKIIVDPDLVRTLAELFGSKEENV